MGSSAASDKTTAPRHGTARSGCCDACALTGKERTVLQSRRARTPIECSRTVGPPCADMDLVSFGVNDACPRFLREVIALDDSSKASAEQCPDADGCPIEGADKCKKDQKRGRASLNPRREPKKEPKSQDRDQIMQ